MKKAMGTVLALALCIVAGVAHAEHKTHGGAKVSMDTPSGWKTQPNGDALVMMDPKEQVLVVARVIESSDLKSVVQTLDAKMAGFVEGAAWEKKAKELKLNGMNAITLDGKGKVKGQPVELGVLIVQTPTKKLFMMLAIAEAAHMNAHKTEIAGLLGSIKPAQ